MTSAKGMRLLRFAAALAIVALGMILWAIHDSGVIPVMIAMSLGQGLGTLSLVLYLVVLVTDVRRRFAEPGATILRSGNPPPPRPEGEETEGP